MKHTLIALTLLTSMLAGCSAYIPPGAKADLQAFAPASIQEGFAAKPTAPFPASIAVVRVQAPTYVNYYLQQNGGKFGTGRYSVITTREVEEQSQFDRVAKLPQVSGLVSINRMLLPERLESDRELREAASRLQADLIILYTFDTSFFDTDLAKPLTVITLGLSPTRKISVTTTASALLLDTRTGYIYSAYEVTTKADTLATSPHPGVAAIPPMRGVVALNARPSANSWKSLSLLGQDSWTAMQNGANPSIEGTSSSGLRPPPAAPHVKR